MERVDFCKPKVYNVNVDVGYVLIAYNEIFKMIGEKVWNLRNLHL